MARTGYPADRVHLVAGRVEDTIPGARPEQIAVLRLDTDWYASTRHELRHLWPALVPGGVCIIDDYGHWAGARKAVDEYFAEIGVEVLMHRVDYTARLVVKDWAGAPRGGP
jgi:O-methyltransferase